MELHAVEERGSGWKTRGQWPSMAGSAVMILHGSRAGFPVVTDTGCCPSAAGCSQPGPSDHNMTRVGAFHSSRGIHDIEQQSVGGIKHDQLIIKHVASAA
jgi:hypothetical protein